MSIFVSCPKTRNRIFDDTPSFTIRGLVSVWFTKIKQVFKFVKSYVIFFWERATDTLMGDIITLLSQVHTSPPFPKFRCDALESNQACSAYETDGTPCPPPAIS